MPEGFSDSLPLGRSTLDRDAVSRDRPGVLEDSWADPATRVAVLSGGRALLTEDGSGLALLPPTALPDGALLLYLGRTTEEGDPPVGTVVLGAVYDRPPVDGEWADLRLDGARLSARDAGLFAELLGLANWHRTAGFSPRSGASTVVGRGGWVRHPDGFEAEASGEHVFPRTDAAVIMGVVDGRDRLLLARNQAWPERRVSVLAGFVEPGESFEAAVRREVQEEVDVRVGACEYLGSQPWPFPASVMVGFIARTEEPGEVELRPDGEEIREARWWSRDDLRTAAGTELLLPGRTSIARAIIEHWYGGRLEGDW
ncbi:NAD(+) diphosphatase [Amnibacterium kyonggiense]|uniref:NAD(+) diphosphatase n=1 Tax=Amnibacterium kyonggiense TaxID=595671 RepID=A0A4R7FG96_9MICO|nr:NAD(+) diphosphatase [Amnibacterium kyonggiense]TDS75960.1 NAD+ diphosphatase [Amnibacterium kyonggiense]